MSRAMTRPPGRRSAPKDRIQDRKGNACDRCTLFQRFRFRIQGLPLDGIGRLLSPSGDLVRGKSYVCFGILPVHRAKSCDLFLPLMCLFPCQSAKIFGRPWFLLFSFPFLGRPWHSTVGTLNPHPSLRERKRIHITLSERGVGDACISIEGCGLSVSTKREAFRSAPTGSTSKTEGLNDRYSRYVCALSG